MNPATPETAELLSRLRQQLILAQVRIMELEDSRDELLPRLTELESLLAAAQSLADRKIDEAMHLEKVREDVQAQFEHMRHMQHVTNEALNEARRELAALGTRAEESARSLAATEERADRVQREFVTLASQARGLQEHVDRLALDLAAATAEAAARGARSETLETEIRALKASRSWRWTAWLRSLERVLGGRQSLPRPSRRFLERSKRPARSGLPAAGSRSPAGASSPASRARPRSGCAPPP